MSVEHRRAALRGALAGLLVAVAAPSSAAAQGSGLAADREGVRRAALDYIEGFYEGDSTKLVRSVRPEVYKFGFSRHRDSTTYRQGTQMTWAGFMNFARGVKENNRPAPPTAPRKVEIYEVLDQTASAKVTAYWGTDYLLLAKFGDRWMITHVLWQSPPRARPAGGGGDDGNDGPELFAGDVISTGNVYRGTFAPDGRTFLFFRKVATDPNLEDYRIFQSRLVDGRWTAPERVTLGGEHSDLYPALSPDGRRLVFSSYRRAPGDTSSKPNAHLWYADRAGDAWGPPVFVAKASVLGHYHSGVQVLADGSVHYGVTTPDWRPKRTYLSRWTGREYGAPEPLDPAERWEKWRDTLYVWGARPAPDLSFAFIEISRIDSATRKRGAPDLWVTYRRGDDWSEPQPLRGGVNTPATENFPFLSADGRELYFVRDFARFYRVPLAEALPPKSS